MAAAVKYQSFVTQLAAGTHAAALNADTDVLKVALTDTAPDHALDANLADAAEIAAGNGYVAGGNDAQNAATTATGTITLAGTDVVFTASGGSIGPFRYAILYNATPAGGPLIQSWDYGSSITLADGETFTVDFGANLLTVS